MKNYTITKEQILELHESNSPETRIQIAKMFPDAFKKELEVGKWYKRLHNSALFYVTEILNIDSNHCKVFGFDYLGNWMSENAKTFPDNDFEATSKQVETALINQAKKRGFIDGAKFKSFEKGNPIRTINENGYCGFSSDSNVLVIGTSKTEWDNYQSNPVIFEKGKWAQIIPQEKQVIPMEKALKIIAKKLKTSPDNIEIK